ncbi:MAG: hypothetical protein DRI61_11135 [Chloroflexi bacterium]|nr:MAG: hypothetical protein DRI61_11135 [Chloroflexota bacterium]HDN80431.1 CoA transferase [Chloroflexota bacterium]
MAKGPLSDIVVIDLSRILAGPYCTMLLGDLGAEVIKIEVPGKGDGSRQWGPPWAGGESAYYLSINRNKKSITLNLKSEKGREILRKLIEKGDVLVENFLPGTMERWGLSYEEVSEINPRIIYCSITGYGQYGPYKDRPGYDFIIQAQGGIMSITGPPEGPPMKRVEHRLCATEAGTPDHRFFLIPHFRFSLFLQHYLSRCGVDEKAVAAKVINFPFDGWIAEV